jgi:hypothetical protein
MTKTNEKSPRALAAKHGTKQELVAKVQAVATGDLWIDRLNGDKGLEHVSNAKLLRLHAVFTKAAARFSSRAQIIDAIVAAEGRAKDNDYKSHFAAWPVPRLMDRLGAVEKAQKSAAKKSAAKAK